MTREEIADFEATLSHAAGEPFEMPAPKENSP
jgi:hypothetical protein